MKRGKKNPETKFAYRSSGPHPSLPAQSVGEELERIREKHEGVLKAEIVVDESRPQDAVLHEELDLHVSDAERAECWSRHKARNIINVVTIVPPPVPDGKDSAKQDEPVRAYVNVVDGSVVEPESRSYMSIQDVLSDPKRRANLVQRALEKLVRVQREFRILKELEVLWNAIDEFIAEDAEK